MASRPVVPGAIPSTPAQRGRRERILEAATAILIGGGEDALQMKELAQRADVSLATLYRYFPAKDHVLMAIALSSYERALDLVRAERPRGGTVRERVTAHLLREFRAGQREIRLTAALTRAVSETSRSYGATIEQIEAAHLRVVRHVAADGGALSQRHELLLPVVVDVFSAAFRRWLAGMCAPAQARLEIRLGAHLLDLPGETVDELARLADPEPGGAGGRPARPYR
jgi:TetR/AcrR family transcriptional regulator, cholesterol catabolism regulator